jgi:hypothetical protein
MQAAADAAIEVVEGVRDAQELAGTNVVLPRDAYFARGAALRSLSLNTRESPSIDVVRTQALPLLPVVRLVSAALLAIAESMCHHREEGGHEDAVSLKHKAAAAFTQAADVACKFLTGPQRARDRSALHCASSEEDKVWKGTQAATHYRLCGVSESAWGCPTTLRALSSEQLAEAQAIARVAALGKADYEEHNHLAVAGLSKLERNLWLETSHLRAAAGAFDGSFDDVEAARLADESLLAYQKAQAAEKRCMASAGMAIVPTNRLRGNALLRYAGSQACRDVSVSPENIAAAACSAGIEDIVDEDKVERILDAVACVGAQ